MKPAIFILLCIFPLLCIGQATPKRLHFGLALSPSIEGFYNPATTKNTLKDREKLSYNFGIKTRYFIANRLSITSGLLIYTKGFTYTVPLASIPGQPFNFAKLSPSIWYLTLPLILQAHIPLPNHHALSPTIGLTYGRKVLHYIHQLTPTRNFYYFSEGGSSENHLGLVAGLSYTTRLKSLSKSVVIEVNPCYIRQMNSGWKYTPASYPNSRFDSYLLELTFYGIPWRL